MRRAPELDLRRYVRVGALWALSFVVLIVLAVRWMGVEETLARLGALEPGLVLLVFGLSLGNYLLRSIRWQGLCEALGVNLPFVRNALYYVAGFAFTVTPGKLGEVVRLWLLRRDCGAAYERTLGLLLVDRLTDVVPLLALCLLGASRFAGQRWGLVVAVVLVVVNLVLVARPDWLAAVVKAIYGQLRRAPRLFARALRLLRALQHLVAPKVLARALLLGLAGWSAEVLGAWLILDGLGAQVDLVSVAFVFAFGMLVGGLPLFPGGVGGAEATMVALLLFLGVDTATALTATALIRLATLGFAVALGFLALPVAVARPPLAALAHRGAVR
jgi:uncharacterized protein (TIRG00374 family)